MLTSPKKSHLPWVCPMIENEPPKSITDFDKRFQLLILKI